MTSLAGVVTSSNVSLTDSMSGILGMGFPRLSDISQAANGESLEMRLIGIHSTEALQLHLSLQRSRNEDNSNIRYSA